MFLERADLEQERWRPYRRWAELLGPRHTIINFNYDRVVEMLSPQNLKVAGVDATNVSASFPLLVKLHGSVDWQRCATESDVEIKRSPDQNFAVTCPDDELCIATPGPAKAFRSAELASLWEIACSALREADRIVFIGYRFPETDALARERLLGAIAQNKGEPGPAILKVEMVLGPDRNHKDVVRLAEMLRVVADRGRPAQSLVDVHPLFAEDYFSIL